MKLTDIDLIRTRTRRDGDPEVFGLTDRVSGAHWLMWRIGDGPLRTTKDLAVAAAAGRVVYAPGHVTVLDGEVVTEADTVVLYQACVTALDTSGFACFLCRGSVYRAGLCYPCYGSETGDE